jgi:hypothetical protein
LPLSDFPARFYQLLKTDFLTSYSYNRPTILSVSPPNNSALPFKLPLFNMLPDSADLSFTPLFTTNEYYDYLVLMFPDTFLKFRPKQIGSSDTFKESFLRNALAGDNQDQTRITLQNKSKTKIYPITLCKKFDIINRNLNISSIVNSMKGKTNKKTTREKVTETVTQEILVPAKAKKLDDYEHSTPLQLTLFEVALSNEKEFSNTVELYDFIPKYHWGKVQRINDKFLDSLEREFECRGIKYKVKIRPASVEDRNGKERYYYPSKREELVEDALRKFVAEGQGVFLDEQAGVTFSLYQLQEELKRNGHSYSKDQIKDALLICARTNMTVTSDNGTSILVSNLFETLGLQTREDWLDQNNKSRAFVRFNSLVTKSITSRSFRQLNYEKVMSYKNVIARQLHKRMSHHYVQASVANPYHLLLSTIIRDFGLTQYTQLRDNLRDVQIALEEMVEKKVLLSFKVEKVLENSKRSKLLDAKFIVIPDPSFTSEIIGANKLQAKIKNIEP